MKRVVRVHKIASEELGFFGHSLGGFIAEGVGNDYPGSRTGTVQSGSPVLARGAIPAAFNPRKKGSFPAFRFVRQGDFVTAGIENMGNGIVVKRARAKVEPRKNWWTRTAANLSSHKNIFSRVLGKGMKKSARVVHHVHSVVSQHSLFHFMPWMEESINEGLNAD